MSSPSRPARPVTQRDVANAAGVSVATVSHVLSGRDDRVGAETRQRVLEAIRRTGYRAPQLAPSIKERPLSMAFLIGGRSPQPLLSHPYLLHLLDGALEEATRQGSALTLFAEGDWEITGRSVRALFDGRYDGVLCAAPNADDPTIAHLVERGMPVVTLGTALYDWPCPSIGPDDAGIVTDAVRRLRQAGHARIAYLGAPPHVLSSSVRERVWREASGDETLHATSSAEAVAEAADRLRALSVTGVLAWNDTYARWLLEAWRSQYGPVPETLSVIGVDGFDIGGLSTFRQPVGLIGRRGVDRLVLRLADPLSPPDHEAILCDWVDGGTVGPPAQGGSLNRVSYSVPEGE